MASRAIRIQTLSQYIKRPLSARYPRTILQSQLLSSQMSSQSEIKPPQPQLSQGQDAADVTTKLAKLSAPGDLTKPRWTLVLDGKGVQRSFKFKTFNKTWAFMNAVAEQCKVQRHHPEWSNRYNSTTVLWTTHRPEGLSVKDVDMAAFCDEQARLHDEQIASE